VSAGTGSVTLGGAVGTGASGALADLDATAATINLNGGTYQIDDQGGNTITFTGAVVLGSNVTIDTDGALDNNVSFTGTINADDSTTQNRTLTVSTGTGSVTFSGSVGTAANGALADLDVTAATINLNGGAYQIDDQG